MTDHPITPPPELVEQWMTEAHDQPPGPDARVIATQAARWGADTELKACELYLAQSPYPSWAKDLREYRRPKPPSQAEQAIAELDEAVMRGDCITTTDAMPSLRAALKRLAELEVAQ